MKNEKFYVFILFLVAFIWGSGFIATQIAMDYNYSAAFIMAYRFTVATLIFGIAFKKDLKEILKKENFGAVITGLVLFFSFAFQTYALEYTSPSNNAFITATYVVIIPFFSWIFFSSKPRWNVFLATGICLLGVTILSVDFKEGFTAFGYGEILTFICAIGFAVHTLLLGEYANKIDTKALVFLQMLTSSILSIILFALTDGDFLLFVPNKNHMPVLYLGVFSTSICYFLQTTAQKVVSPSKTSIIVANESVFAAVLSVILAFELFRINLLIGGILVLLSVILAEWQFKKI